jgi:hypothetical protein
MLGTSACLESVCVHVYVHECFICVYDICIYYRLGARRCTAFLDSVFCVCMCVCVCACLCVWVRVCV